MAKKNKRKAPRMTVAIIKKMLANPRTPPGLRAYWQKRLKQMEAR